MTALLLVACGGGSDEPAAEPKAAPTVMPICEKDDPKNVLIECRTVDGLRSCRTVNKCR